MVTNGSDTWGISGPDFLLLYLGLCGVAALALLVSRRRSSAARDGAGQLDVYDLAMLNGGPGLAVTTAAAALRQGGFLRPGDRRRTLVAEGRPPAEAAPIERAVFDVVERRPEISTRALRRELAAGPSIAEKRAKMVASGLLRDHAAARRLLALELLGAAALLGLGVARLVAGLANHRPVGFLIVVLVGVGLGSPLLLRRRPAATPHGRALLGERRDDRKGLKRTALAPAEIPLAVALFGAGALWAADPAFASAWGIPREGGAASGGSSWGGGGGGCGGGGGGGCGGGGCGG